MQVCLVHQGVAVVRSETAKVMFRPCVGNIHLVVSVVGCSGGVQVQC